jgi:aspartyl protease family protein
VVKAYYLKLDKVRVGDIELRDIPASVIEGNHPTEVLLGQSFLNQLIMRRDGQMMELITK